MTPHHLADYAGIFADALVVTAAAIIVGAFLYACLVTGDAADGPVVRVDANERREP